ncbi:tyrosine-type DNA invertase [Serratia fonticola]|uniref:tyrosine-type DNA invertase n=1 Tax=Serratia fonticola TaxID=47917 RepID=UPI00301D5366
MERTTPCKSNTINLQSDQGGVPLKEDKFYFSMKKEDNHGAIFAYFPLGRTMTQRKYLTLTEIQSLLDSTLLTAHPKRNYCLIYMSFIHGLRVSEVSRLRISDLDLNEGILQVRRIKNGFSTIHPLLPDEIGIIKAWLRIREQSENAASDWLFLSKKGNPLSRQRIYAIIRELSEQARLSISAHPHMLRHACGFALADRGIDTRLIQDYLGHRNIRHTVRYTASNAQRFSGIWHEQQERKNMTFRTKLSITMN